jgi:hypothetical protein
MKRAVSWTSFALIAGLALPQSASSQYYPPTALRPATVAATQRDLDRSATESQIGEAGSGVAHDALVGAAVGAGVGLVTAVVATTQPGVTDHSEDVLAYVVFIGLGAGLGLAAGALVGVVRH